MCWANITSASLWASATALVGAAAALDDEVCPAGCSGSLEPLQPVEMASTTRAPAPLKDVRVHMVIVSFYTLFIP
jgi:hypothetical protein